MSDAVERNPDAGADDHLTATLRPIVARALDVGAGPPALLAWLAGAARSVGVEDRHDRVGEFVRRLAEALRGCGHLHTLPEQRGQTLGAAGLRG